MLDAELIARRGALRKRLWIALIGRRTLAYAAAIVATSEIEAAAIRHLHLALAPIEVVPNGIDLEKFVAPDSAAVSEPIRRASSAGPYVLHLGRLSWKKQLDVLIDALPLVAGVRLVLAGPDDERLGTRLAERARDAGVADRLIYVGEVDGADRVALLRAACALALPSVGENFGNAVLEAMACGVPVLVSPGVGLAGEVRRSRCGRVADGDPAALAAALGEILADPLAAREMGERGRRAVATGYTWTAVAARMRDVYCDAGAG
jgi:glycosyltransferase involved in cell wall biosynthesis